MPKRQRERVKRVVVTGLDMNQSVILEGVSIQHDEDPRRDRSVTVIEL